MVTYPKLPRPHHYCWGKRGSFYTAGVGFYSADQLDEHAAQAVKDAMQGCAVAEALLREARDALRPIASPYETELIARIDALLPPKEAA